MSPPSEAQCEYAVAAPYVVTPRERPRSRVSALFYVGPAFLVSVGYIDPGNWATSLEAGSRFGYRLLWVVLLSNLIALVIQNLAARLGLVTGESYAANCRRHFGRPVWLSIWLTTEAALVATDVAEFLGAMLGFQLVLGVNAVAAAILSALATFALLALSRFGDRVVEAAIIGFVALVGCCYVFELSSIRLDWIAIGRGTVTPWLDWNSTMVAAGILGATVMPHNLFLHSSVVRRKIRPQQMSAAIRATFADSFLALNSAWLINAAIAITAASVFFSRGVSVTSIMQAHATLEPLLGRFAASVFGLGLLAAGVSSSATATLTGQIVIDGFFRKQISVWVRRGLTLVPALVIILFGSPGALLIASQVALSLLLPFALVPLIFLTARRSVMGAFANGRLSNLLACGCVLIVLLLNALVVLFAIY